VGWSQGGGRPDQGRVFAEQVRKAWKQAGKPGEPRIVALTYFALGEGAEDKAAAYLTDYYGQYGPQIVQRIPKTADALKETVSTFEGYGFDELFLDPTIADLAQLESAAEAVL